MANNSFAIVVAGALVAASLLLALLVDRYQISGGATVNGVPAVWRLNVRTGVTTICILASESEPRSQSVADQYRVECR
jgi:hypothetical protein